MIAQVQKNTKNTSRIQMLLALALAAATQPAATAPAPAEEVVVVMYTVKSLVAAQPAKEEVYGTSTSMVEVEAEAVVGAQPVRRVNTFVGVKAVVGAQPVRRVNTFFVGVTLDWWDPTGPSIPN